MAADDFGQGAAADQLAADAYSQRGQGVGIAGDVGEARLRQVTGEPVEVETPKGARTFVVQALV